MEKNLDTLNTDLNKTKNVLKEKKQSFLEEKRSSLFDINQNQIFLDKYFYMLNKDFKNEYIYIIYIINWFNRFYDICP